MEPCDGQDERAPKGRRLPLPRLGRLSGPVLVAPRFCSGLVASRSGSTPARFPGGDDAGVTISRAAVSATSRRLPVCAERGDQTAHVRDRHG
jgi:hypothetical protein